MKVLPTDQLAGVSLDVAEAMLRETGTLKPGELLVVIDIEHRLGYVEADPRLVDQPNEVLGRLALPETSAAIPVHRTHTTGATENTRPRKGT